MINSSIELENLHVIPPDAKPLLGDVFSPRIEVANNIEFMQTIESNSIDLIYCDVLYGTGRNFGEYQDLKPIRSEIENHYIPRIKEMYRLLSENGCIYLQMDTRINHWLRLILDDIFGYDNFRNEISWCYRSSGFSKYKWSQKHDVILFYTKSKKYTFNMELIRETEISKSTQKRFSKDISETGLIPNLKNGKMYYVSPYSPPKDWINLNTLPQAHKERVGYPTQKPKELLKRLILSVTNENDLVADFYLGSGTTAVVCKELNRRFVGCDVNANAVKITNERLNGTLF